MGRECYLLGAFVSPEKDVETWGEAVSLVAADVGEPEGAGLEGAGVAALRHEVDAVWGEF